MEQEIIEAGAPPQQRSEPLSDYSTPASVMPQLAACFALVRPVGMTEDAATEWLAVAAHELAGYRQWMVESGLKAARKTCTHHGQIIPAALEHMRKTVPWESLQRKDETLSIAPPPEIQGLIDSVSKALSAPSTISRR